MGLFQIVPDANAEGFLVREQNVSFDALAVIDHHVDHIARLNSDFAVRDRETARSGPGLRICIRNRR